MVTTIKELESARRWSWYKPGSKIPVIPINMPEIWLDRSTAKRAMDGCGTGFAFKLEDNLVGIDLDNCIENGQLTPIAAKILAMTGDSYAEVSQSGRGIKIWGSGKKSITQTMFKVMGQTVELYNRDKWFMCTSKVLKGRGSAVTDISEAVEYIESFQDKPKDITRMYQAPPPFANREKAINLAMTLPPAISGSLGHRDAYGAALRIMACGLSITEGMHIFKQFYNPRCKPQWSESEIAHKIKDAHKRINK